ncbi:hypothetical protein [Rhodoplanes azumiensis]|uniref:Uncharacterized protein n=1 Tax=Rhodoplanes azumiensis TaxID=1897628 RepID=A0ABW5AI10_9BRAD
MTPMTHHEILRLVAPFTRRGLRLDPAASDRQRRRLVFAPHPPAADPHSTDAGEPVAGDAVADRADGVAPFANVAAGRITVVLDAPAPEAGEAAPWRLTRVLDDPAGVTARLEAEGRDLDALLDRLAAVAPERHIRTGPGWVIATSWRLDSSGGGSDALVLTGGVARLGDVVLTLKMPALRRYLADLEITTVDGSRLDLTEDLLAVLGTDWSTLRRYGTKWVGTLKPHGREPGRSRAAEAALTTSADHLARTLAEPPSRFHARLYRARWGVVLRRAVPLLVSLVLLVGSLFVSKLDLDQNSGLWVVMFHAPPLMLVVFFCLREIPRIEIPPLPRISATATWRPTDVPGAPAASDMSRG